MTEQMHITPTAQVVVIGGGYAGTLAANRLRRRPDVAVTLVNPRPRFVERIRLHQLAAGTGAATVEFATLLAPGVRLVVDTAVHIDPAARTVQLAAGPALRYDWLIYAAGSVAAPPEVPGAAEFAYPIAELEDAERLRAALERAGAQAPVVVAGGGTTGIEVAAELAERGRPVTLACGGPLGPYLSGAGRRSVARRLARLGVTVLDGPGSVVTAVRPDGVRLADGGRRAAAVTVWTAGFGAAGLAARSGLRTDPAGRLLTDETLTSLDDPRILAAGDAAAPSGQPLRMSCQAAMPLGAQAADTVLHRIDGREPAPIRQTMNGQCISLGRRAGTIQVAFGDDRAVPLYLGGRLGALVKEAVCAATVRFLAKEARRPGSYTWIRGRDRRAIAQARV
ncbi:FAD-dependent oxidoreductase [uncultured Mycolicibacterium sp.]|uniref:NAD(P)/FAD-dependent oxidoreductase n=1 Tax=uncultured Mycolicibacterium sp. TaxID=2320817 RepID=UPI00261FF7F8|nr:FAD-dependent oxidoreductase [uncultured Mycolicibacterium sp.]